MHTKSKHKTKTITLYEYQKCSYDEISGFHVDRILDSIENLNKASNSTLFQLGRDHLTATQFVGMIQVEDVVIEILPKIDYTFCGELADANYQTAAANLLVMLAYAYNIKLDSHTVSSLKAVSGNWYELLIRFFAIELYKQIEIGLSRDYQIRSDCLPFIRGKWEVSQQIRRHAYSKVNFDLTFDEFTDNILLNRIFYTITNQLLRQTQDSVSRRLLIDIRRWLAGVDELVEVNNEVLDQIHFSRLNERFKPAFQLARLFLSGQSLQIRSGDTTAYAFVFDMNDLFEGFITNFLIKHRREIFHAYQTIPKIYSQLSNASTYLAKDSFGNRRIHLRPDIVLVNPMTQTHQLIIDTKYKQLNAEKSNLNLSNSDIYQMLAYSLRLSSDKVLLLYPESNNQQPINSHLIIPHDETTTNLYIRTVNLHQNLDDPRNLIEDFRLIFHPIFGG